MPCAPSVGCKLAQPRQKVVWRFLTKLKVKLSQVLVHSRVPASKAARTTKPKPLPCDAAIPPLGICPKERRSASPRDVRNPRVHCSFLQPGARRLESTHRQPAEERIQEGWHTYTMGREQPPERGGDQTICRPAAMDYRSRTDDAAAYSVPSTCQVMSATWFLSIVSCGSPNKPRGGRGTRSNLRLKERD